MELYLDAIVNWIMVNAPQYAWVLVVMIVCTILGSLIDLGEKIVEMTPTKADDEAVAKVYQNKVVAIISRFFKRFSLLPKAEVKKQ